MKSDNIKWHPLNMWLKVKLKKWASENVFPTVCCLLIGYFSHVDRYSPVRYCILERGVRIRRERRWDKNSEIELKRTKKRNIFFITSVSTFYRVLSRIASLVEDLCDMLCCNLYSGYGEGVCFNACRGLTPWVGSNNKLVSRIKRIIFSPVLRREPFNLGFYEWNKK